MHLAESKPSQSFRAKEKLPAGLHWRGGVLWINKTIKGRRYQKSTGCKTIEEGLIVFEEFLLKHGGVIGKRPKARSGHRVDSYAFGLPRGLYWKGNVIWMSRSIKGRHYNVSTGSADPVLAAKFLDDFNLKAFKGERLGVKEKESFSFEELSRRFLEQGKLNYLKDSTLSRYETSINWFLEFLKTTRLKNCQAEQISPRVIEDYKAYRFSLPTKRNGSPVCDTNKADAIGISPSTLRFEVRVIGTVFRYGVKTLGLSSNPCEAVQGIRVPEKVPVHLEHDEILSLLMAARNYDVWANSRRIFGDLFYNIIYVYLKTGMRLEELRHLEWSDVDLASREIFIRQGKKVINKKCYVIPKRLRTSNISPQAFNCESHEKKVLFLKSMKLSKGAIENAYQVTMSSDFKFIHMETTVSWSPKTKRRSIPISGELFKLLSSLKKSSNLVFPDPHFDGLWVFDINKIVKACVRHAGIKKRIHTHTLRHTFATQLRKKSVPLETLKELLGHSNVRDTLIYAHFSKQEAVAAIENIDSF